MDLSRVPRMIPLAIESGGRLGVHWLAFLGELGRFSSKKHLRRAWIQRITAAFHLKTDLILTACALGQISDSQTDLIDEL